jgi:transcriptional regulator with XRE-family HTH domain
MNLKEARIRAGLGRRRASRCIGMGVPQLYRYEAGLLRPGYEVAMRISIALGLDPWLIDEFRQALEKAADAGLIARPSSNGAEGGKSN